jgi:hypothetical protein
MIRTVIFAAAICIFSSCTKNSTTNNGGCTKPSAPAVSSNSPVNTGASINLTASTVNNASYQWSGPGFTSKVQNPVIQGAVPGMSGTYTCTVTVGNCTSDAGSANVTVNPPGQPCSVTPNTMTYSGNNYPLTTVSLMPYCLPNGNKFEINGSDSAGGTIGMIAYFSSTPTKDGVYSVTDHTDPGPFEVYITIQVPKTSRNYHSLAGQLAFVKVNGTSTGISLCSINFDNPAYMNDHMNVTANISCQ